MQLRRVVALIVLMVCAIPAMALDIIDLHENNSAGVPTLLNQEVSVSGIVTSPNGTFSSYNFEVYIQDETGGVNLYVSGGAGTYTAELGDSVFVTATVAHYNGLTELSPPFSLFNFGGGYEVPDPLVITCADLENTFDTGDYSEANEARLIRINNVSLTSGSWPVTTSGSNSILNISDGTATTLLFIDKDSPVNGSPDPGTVFDIIGVVKQYDDTSPYTAGYEISPRFLTDVVIHEPGPPINGVGQVVNVTSNSAIIYFETTTPGSSEVEYGLTDAYGLTAGNPGDAVLQHTVELTGLDANTIYHYRVKSSDGEGTRYGPDQLLAVANDQPGELEIYMSFTVDTSYASEGNEVADNMTLSNQVVSMINSADYSVDACLYSFSLTNVRDALVAAHQRGCLVRLIIEDDNSHTAADYCAGYGIPYITSTFGGNHGSPNYGIMHNKYVVIDGRNGDRYDDWIWTGSGNMSIAGNDDVNNGVKIQDYCMAQAYTIEFDEMWGSDTQTPNASAARLGSDKQDNTPHEFFINGIRIEQYMSPSDGVTDKIVNTVKTADHSVYFAILAFTEYNICNAMRDRRDDDLGGDMEIRGVFDEGLGDCDNGSVYYQMAGDVCSPFAWYTPADVLIDTPLPGSRLLHHKYMIVDANWADDDPLVLTGSHNWSFSANSRNDENTLIIHDQAVANMFLQEFAQRYHESGGTGGLGEVTAVDDYDQVDNGRMLGRMSNFPNPFNPTTNILFTTHLDCRVSLNIYDVTGRKIRTLFEDHPLAAGEQSVPWDGIDDNGLQVSSGVYFVSVTSFDAKSGQGEKMVKKIVTVQ
ncbi:MAG: T9SS type A sorting domain-containing protein [bacterium]|nr:T9SS type A sorting domain-containing protein [bacterium]